MDAKQLEQANIDNLTNLWKLLGYEERPLNETLSVKRSLSWPHRIWFDWDDKPTLADRVAAGQLAADKTIAKFPTWGSVDINEMQAHGFVAAFEQTAMVGHFQEEIAITPNELHFKEVTTPAETAVWADIASQSFGYFIPPAVLQNVVGTPELKLILAICDEEPVATTLLFANSGVVGVHLVGVPPTFRRRGFARKMMQYALCEVQRMGYKTVTLQASPLGELLYQDLGFTRQFTIRSFVFGSEVNRDVPT